MAASYKILWNILIQPVVEQGFLVLGKSYTNYNILAYRLFADIALSF
jgi:hypothetical protein